MFGLLKEKLSNFIGKLAKKEEELAQAAQKEKGVQKEEARGEKMEEPKAEKRTAEGKQETQMPSSKGASGEIKIQNIARAVQDEKSEEPARSARQDEKAQESARAAKQDENGKAQGAKRAADEKAGMRKAKTATDEKINAPDAMRAEKTQTRQAVQEAKPAQEEKPPEITMALQEKPRQAMPSVPEKSSAARQEVAQEEKMPEERAGWAQKQQKPEAKKILGFEIPFFGRRRELPKEKGQEWQKAQEQEKGRDAKEQQPTEELQAGALEEAQKNELQRAGASVQTPQQSAREGQEQKQQERKMEVKIGLGEQIKSIFTGEVQIREGDVRELLEELQMALLEADVAYEVSFAVCDNLKSQLVGMKIKRGEADKAAKSAMVASLQSVLSSERAFDFVERIRGLPKPAVVLFVGPNGAGKTTTMAKLAKMLLQNKMSVVFSASDTFRAAAIEQTQVHANRLGVHVIKSNYGADPAAVAFDAVAYARAHAVDVVLVDSAGRQDTNVNLLDELKKMNRVAKPALKIYIGESIAGNAIMDQIKAFDAAVGVDGVILTKLDCDAKGGTALSITYTTGIPIVFFGVGQEYGDLIAYSPGSLAQEILT